MWRLIEPTSAATTRALSHVHAPDTDTVNTRVVPCAEKSSIASSNHGGIGKVTMGNTMPWPGFGTKAPSMTMLPEKPELASGVHWMVTESLPFT